VLALEAVWVWVWVWVLNHSKKDWDVLHSNSLYKFYPLVDHYHKRILDKDLCLEHI
jgi:hypothetical protein